MQLHVNASSMLTHSWLNHKLLLCYPPRCKPSAKVLWPKCELLTSLWFGLQQPHTQDCWQMDRAACEHLLLSLTQLPLLSPPQPTQLATAAAAAAPVYDAISNTDLQSLPESPAGLGLEGAFPDFAHSGRSDAFTYHEEEITDVPDSQIYLPAVGASSCQEYWHEGPHGVSRGSDHLLQLNSAPGGHMTTCVYTCCCVYSRLSLTHTLAVSAVRL